MGRLGRILASAVFVLFLAAVVVRPLGSNPGVTAALEEGLDWPTVLWLPVVALGLLVAVGRLRRLGDEEESPEWEGDWRQEEPAAGWDGDQQQSESATEDSSAEAATIPDRAGALTGRDDDANQVVQRRLRYRTSPDRIEIEQSPPDAALSEHLEHLQEAFDSQELREFERVAEETDDDPIPDRCPEEHCEARWGERSVLGFGTGRYEVIDDGEAVCCLECESVVAVEEL